MKIIWQVYAVTIGCLLAAGCSGESTVTNNTAIQPMLGAVMHSRPERVRQLAEQGVGLNERDPANQSTPMIAAAEKRDAPGSFDFIGAALGKNRMDFL